jgi:hypothetical protein
MLLILDQTRKEVRSMITVTKKGNKLVIEADIETPTPSHSGKTLVVASTSGNIKTGVVLDNGKEVVLGLTAYFKP